MGGKIINFSQIITHINNNSGFYSLISTLIMALLTAIYVVLTFNLLRESKKAREQQSRPFITFDFEVKNYMVYLKIKNAGNSPAKNIKINIDHDYKNVPGKLEFFPSNREILYGLNLIVDDKPNNNMDKEFINELSKLLEKKLDPINKRLSSIESQQEENNQILRALEYSSEVHKAELDKLNIQVAKLSGNEEKINKLEDGLKNHDHNIIIKSNKANVS